jgi:hypothetical protein
MASLARAWASTACRRFGISDEHFAGHRRHDVAASTVDQKRKTARLVKPIRRNMAALFRQ